jgi:hypothetical protein
VRVYRRRPRKEMGGWSVARLAPVRGRLGPGRFLPGRIRCTSLGIFCTVSLCVCRVVTALSDRLKVGGPLPCQQRYGFNPARPSTARQPVKCPLNARAIDILGLRHPAQQLLLPSSCVKDLSPTSSSRRMNLACPSLFHQRLVPQLAIFFRPASSQSGAYERSSPSPAPGT